MTKTSLAVFMAAIMVVGALGISQSPEAEALKSSGVKVSQYGSNTNICGLVLCSEYPGGKEAYQKNWASSFRLGTAEHADNYQIEPETKKISVSAHNVDEEFPEQLDVFIHKFELDKIAAEEAMDGIMGIYNQYTDARISTDIINGVGEKINLYKTGNLNVEESIEAIHLTAEPQNVNPEYQGALDEVIHKFELDKISAEEAIAGIKEVHGGFVGLYITSDLIEDITTQLNIYESSSASTSHVLHEIHEIVKEAQATLAELESVDEDTMAKELPPNTVDMPLGAGVPGCEEHDACYTPTQLTVSVGTTVTWINSDGSIPHTVTAGWPDSDSIGLDYPGGNGFDSDFMSGGATFEHTFEVPGEYDYYCMLHPWMIGSVTVE